MFTRRPSFDRPNSYDQPAETDARPPLPPEEPDQDRIDLLRLADLLDRGGITDVTVPDQEHAVLFASLNDPTSPFRLRATVEIRTQEGARWFGERGGGLWGKVTDLLRVPPAVAADQLRVRMVPTAR